jgi:hypothetical protein
MQRSAPWERLRHYRFERYQQRWRAAKIGAERVRSFLCIPSLYLRAFRSSEGVQDYETSRHTSDGVADLGRSCPRQSTGRGIPIGIIDAAYHYRAAGMRLAAKFVGGYNV